MEWKKQFMLENNCILTCIYAIVHFYAFLKWFQFGAVSNAVNVILMLWNEYLLTYLDR